MALKDNQGNLYEEVKATFALAEKNRFANIQYESDQTVEKDHGRLEIRRYRTISDPEKNWKGLCGLGMVKAERRLGPEVSEETRYFLLSFPSVKTFAYAVRSHWGIENSLHWVFDGCCLS